MEHTCTTCRYYDLPTNALPCRECSRCNGDCDVEKWAVPFQDISDPFDKLHALCELQAYMMLSIAELREELDHISEVIKERG